MFFIFHVSLNPSLLGVMISRTSRQVSEPVNPTSTSVEAAQPFRSVTTTL